jgi:SRSO17 transposase
MSIRQEQTKVDPVLHSEILKPVELVIRFVWHGRDHDGRGHRRLDEDLQVLTDGLGWLFNRPEPRVTFGLMVRGLLADVAKKNSWGLAEHLGLATPQPLEHLLGGARWDADVLRDEVRGYVLRGLGDRGGALVLDDIRVIKKDMKGVGVVLGPSLMA